MFLQLLRISSRVTTRLVAPVGLLGTAWLLANDRLEALSTSWSEGSLLLDRLCSGLLVVHLFLALISLVFGRTKSSLGWLRAIDWVVEPLLVGSIVSSVLFFGLFTSRSIVAPASLVRTATSLIGPALILVQAVQLTRTFMYVNKYSLTFIDFSEKLVKSSILLYSLVLFIGAFYYGTYVFTHDETSVFVASFAAALCVPLLVLVVLPFTNRVNGLIISDVASVSFVSMFALYCAVLANMSNGGDPSFSTLRAVHDVVGSSLSLGESLKGQLGWNSPWRLFDKIVWAALFVVTLLSLLHPDLDDDPLDPIGEQDGVSSSSSSGVRGEGVRETTSLWERLDTHVYAMSSLVLCYRLFGSFAPVSPTWYIVEAYAIVILYTIRASKEVEIVPTQRRPLDRWN